MKENGTFEIQYNDGTQFVGNLFKKDWGKVSNSKRIKNIIFSFGNHSVKMEEFREYNLTFETHMVIGKGSKLVNVTLVGRKEYDSILHIFDCVHGKLLRKEIEKYKEYKWISSTWKDGIIDGEAKDYHG